MKLHDITDKQKAFLKTIYQDRWFWSSHLPYKEYKVYTAFIDPLSGKWKPGFYDENEAKILNNIRERWIDYIKDINDINR